MAQIGVLGFKYGAGTIYCMVCAHELSNWMNAYYERQWRITDETVGSFSLECRHCGDKFWKGSLDVSLSPEIGIPTELFEQIIPNRDTLPRTIPPSIMPDFSVAYYINPDRIEIEDEDNEHASDCECYDCCSCEDCVTSRENNA